MIKNIHLNRDIAQLILLQRIELLNPFLKRVRKILGRYFFTNFASKYFISPKLIFDTIRPDYFKTMFQNIEIIDSMQSTVHKSTRVICGNFIL